jgi:hypothetical protein
MTDITSRPTRWCHTAPWPWLLLVRVLAPRWVAWDNGIPGRTWQECVRAGPARGGAVPDTGGRQLLVRVLAPSTVLVARAATGREFESLLYEVSFFWQNV